MAFIKNGTLRQPPGDEREQPRDVAALVLQLGDPDPTARRWAARDLLPHPQGTAALVDRLQVEQDSAVREVILTALARAGDPIAVAGLVECLRSEDAQLRNEAIEAMKALPDEMAPVMGGLLSGPDPDVRILAVNILESLPHPQVEAWLIDVIERDPVVNVCATAVDLLGEVGTAAAQGALVRLKQRFADEPYIQFAADLALQRITKT